MSSPHRKKRKTPGNSLRFAGILAGIGLVLIIAFLFFRHRERAGHPEFPKPPGARPYTRTGKPRTECKSERHPARLPRIAIIIDDMGYAPRLEKGLMELGVPISFSFMPFGPHTKEIADFAHRHKKDVLLHLPMEAVAKESKLGPGAIFVAMGDREIADRIRADIEAVPHIKGVNNHMGSKFTADDEKMALVISEIRRRRMFFVDSRTTPETRGSAIASSMGVKTAERDVFLDNVKDAAAIRQQLSRLVSIAESKGSAIGIGHSHAVTYEVLRRELPYLKNKVEIVPVSELVR
ncbi:MAG: divergent polysaccharide deacetylase family protein [Pseudomonadota bacterium]